MAAVMVTTGWCLWQRRLAWYCLPVDRVTTLGCTLVCVALLLFRAHHVIAPIGAVTGTPYVEQFLGHLCLLAASGAHIYAAAARLVPDWQLRPLLGRMDIPAAVAAAAMLVCFVCSDARARRPRGDFLALHRDVWLNAYWLIWAAMSVYLLGFLLWLMLTLRRDPRSSSTATMFVVACMLGIVSRLLRVATIVTGGQVDPLGVDYRLFLYACVAVATAAAARSWRARLAFRGDDQPERVPVSA